MIPLGSFSYSNYIWGSNLFGGKISFLWLVLRKWKTCFRFWRQRGERFYNPLNNLSKTWVIYLNKEKCYSREKDILSCLKWEEIVGMRGKEQKIIFFMGLSSIHLQCPRLSSCTIWSPAVDHLYSVDVTLTPHFNHAKVTVSRVAPYVVL